MSPDVGLCAQLACVWEVTARKPGNVHRYHDFDDATYLDFILSAAAIAPVLTTARQRRVGSTVLECVKATRQVVATNTNLGIILLLAPLAAVQAAEDLRSGVQRVLAGLGLEDARLAYEAIRLAMPGGLGAAPAQDVAGEPTRTLREVMALAADRDIVARQYANDFREIFEDGVPALTTALAQTRSLEAAIVQAQLQLMVRHPDTLIARKCGAAQAAEAAKRAARVLAAGWPEMASGRRELADFDGWLRDEGHARNPGATADLITAVLFVLLREEVIPLPVSFSWPKKAIDAAWR
jgi:triphosphoribosyl-dephospho-CoA synthase